MTICVKCKKEMVCTATGVYAYYGNDHVYAGNEYECLTCGKKVLNTDQVPYRIKDFEKRNTNYVDMRKG